MLCGCNKVKQGPQKFRIVLLGDIDVGKSAFITQYIKSKFIDENCSIAETYLKKCKVNRETVKLEIMDITSEEAFKPMRDQYIKHADGFILLFSLVNKNSFFKIYSIYQEVLSIKMDQKVPMIICANKLDRLSERVIQYSDIQALLKELQLPYLETSAKTRHNIDEAFSQLVKMMKPMPITDSQCNLI